MSECLYTSLKACKLSQWYASCAWKTPPTAWRSASDLSCSNLPWSSRRPLRRARTRSRFSSSSSAADVALDWAAFSAPPLSASSPAAPSAAPHPHARRTWRDNGRPRMYLPRQRRCAQWRVLNSLLQCGTCSSRSLPSPIGTTAGATSGTRRWLVLWATVVAVVTFQLRLRRNAEL